LGTYFRGSCFARPFRLAACLDELVGPNHQARKNGRPANPAFSSSPLASDVLDLRGFAGATVRTPTPDSDKMRGFKTQGGQ
jgi:hypothetical protein